jgi:iron complex outermembrane receptor protein
MSQTSIEATRSATAGTAVVSCLIFAVLHGARADAQSVPTADASSNELQEVVVTAERRTADVQKLGISVDVIQGQDLLQESRNTTDQILEDVPNVTVAQGQNNRGYATGTDNVGSSIAIRGIPSNHAPTGPLSEVPAAAVYTDGVYEGIGANYDQQRVEVLRGPQGTLYGRSATTGVVSTYTVDPQLNAFTGDVAVEAGNYSLSHFTGAINVPIGDTLAVRLSGNQYKHDGYIQADGDGGIRTTDGRAKILFKPNDRLTLLFGAAIEGNELFAGGSYYELASPPRTLALETGTAVNGPTTQHQYWANLQLDVGFATVTYIPAYRQWYQDTKAWITFLAPLSPSLYTGATTPTDQFITHELRIASNAGSPLTWQLGSFYYDNHVHAVDNFYFSNGVSTDIQDATRTTKDWGIFGEATYPITPSTRLTAGARYDYTFVQSSEQYTSNLDIFCNTPVYVLGCAAGALRAPPGQLPLAGTPVDDYTTTLTPSEGTNRYYNLTYKGRISTR